MTKHPRITALRNARVPTLDDLDSTGATVVIEAGRIVWVGTGQPPAGVADPGVQTVDLGGATVLPGFIDPHCHPLALGAALEAVDCGPREVRSIDELVQRLTAAARTVPGDGWLRGRGYDELLIADRRHPTRHDLDRVSTERPVRLTHGSGHADVLNTSAMRAVGLVRDTTAPPGGFVERDPATGDPTGVLFEMSGWLRARTPSPGRAILERRAALASGTLLAAGVTAVTDAGPGNTAARLELYAELAAAGRFQPGVIVMMAPGEEPLDDAIPSGIKGEICVSVRPGPTKIVVSYSSGELRPGFDSLVETIASAHAAGRRVALHAVEVEAVVMACEALTATVPVEEIRARGHRIEHVSECPPGVADMIAASGATVVTQPGFVFGRGDRYLAAALEGGPEPDTLYPLRRLIDAGVPVAASSDAPAGPAAPLQGVAAAVMRRTATGAALGRSQAIAVRTAVGMYGPAAARAAGIEESAGTVEQGKRADLVILAADPLTADPAAIPGIEVLATLVGGRVVHGSL